MNGVLASRSKQDQRQRPRHYGEWDAQQAHASQHQHRRQAHGHHGQKHRHRIPERQQNHNEEQQQRHRGQPSHIALGIVIDRLPRKRSPAKIQTGGGGQLSAGQFPGLDGQLSGLAAFAEEHHHQRRLAIP